MTDYCCIKCDMEIKPLICSKCQKELVIKTITKDGKDVQVCECPSCCGKIKSPQCCGEDMKAS